MKIETHKTENISWDIDGCDAHAGVLTEPEKGTYINGLRIVLKTDEDNNCFVANDEQFIRDVHKALTGLINHVDKARGVGRSLESSTFVGGVGVTLTKEE